MKILFVGTPFPPQVGGVGTVIFSLTKELVKLGHKCIVLTEQVKKMHAVENYDEVLVIRYPKIKYLYGFNPIIFYYIMKLVKKYDVDIVHIHGYHNLLSLECAVFLKFKKIPFIFSPHYHGTGHRLLAKKFFRVYRHIGKKIFQYASYVICVSNYEENLIIKDFNISKNKICVIPNGINKINRTSYIKNFINNKMIKLLYVGRIEKYKGIEYLIKIIPLIKSKYNKDVKLTIIGKGPDANRLFLLARELGVSNDVIWYDSVDSDELDKMYRSHDILLLLSDAEAFGLVVAEALSNGLPCLVLKRAALTEFLNETGCFGVDYPIDLQKLAKSVVEIFEKDNIKIGPFTSKIKTWSEITKLYEKLYYKVYCYESYFKKL